MIIREDSIYYNSTCYSQGYRQARQLVRPSSAQGAASAFCYVLRGGSSRLPSLPPFCSGLSISLTFLEMRSGLEAESGRY